LAQHGVQDNMGFLMAFDCYIHTVFQQRNCFCSNARLSFLSSRFSVLVSFFEELGTADGVVL
jgi:hypothetical protein